MTCHRRKAWVKIMTSKVVVEMAIEAQTQDIKEQTGQTRGTMDIKLKLEMVMVVQNKLVKEMQINLMETIVNQTLSIHEACLAYLLVKTMLSLNLTITLLSTLASSLTTPLAPNHPNLIQISSSCTRATTGKPHNNPIHSRCTKISNTMLLRTTSNVLLSHRIMVSHKTTWQLQPMLMRSITLACTLDKHMLSVVIYRLV